MRYMNKMHQECNKVQDYLHQQFTKLTLFQEKKCFTVYTNVSIGQWEIHY
jgi:hypothetical protein